MMQKGFATRVVDIVKADENVIGLAVSGSWLSKDLDDYSDLDLILVTRTKVSGDVALMNDYARRFGKLLNGFTGEHVGEPRVLVCLYDDPLLHVDIKFLLPEEFKDFADDPQILYDPEGELERMQNLHQAIWPFQGYQWLEDRFWIWVHYAATKLARGEYFEALEFLSFLRVTVLSPLQLIRNNKLPKGVRRIEWSLPPGDLRKLKATIATYNPASILQSLWNCIELYQSLRDDLYPEAVHLQQETERRSLEYLREMTVGIEL